MGKREKRFFLVFITVVLFVISSIFNSKVHVKSDRNTLSSPTVSQLNNSQRPSIMDTNSKNNDRLWVNIIEIKNQQPNKSLIIDYLEYNPCWTPGGPPKPSCPESSFYLNRVEERIEVPLSPNTRVYNCTQDKEGNIDPGPDNDATNADTEIPLEQFLAKLIKNKAVIDYYINIQNNKITAIYERCLP